MSELTATEKQPDKFLTVRITAKLHAKLEAFAEANERTMAAEVRRAIRELLNREDGAA